MILGLLFALACDAGDQRRPSCSSIAGDRVSIELLAPGAEFVQRPASVLHPFDGTAAPRVQLDRLSELGIARHRGALAAVDAQRHEIRTTDGGASAMTA